MTTTDHVRMLGRIWIRGSVVAYLLVLIVVVSVGHFAEHPKGILYVLATYLIMLTGPFLIPIGYTMRNVGSAAAWATVCILPLMIGFLAPLSQRGRIIAFSVFSALWFLGSFLAVIAGAS